MNKENRFYNAVQGTVYVYTQVYHYNLLAIYCVPPCYSELCVLTEEEEGHQKAGTVCEGDSGGPLIVRVRHHRLRAPF